MDESMKAKEAPEKLYITYKGYGVFDEDSTVERTKDSQTEYIRTDAFIQKACDAYCQVCGHYAHDTPTHVCRQACDYYKDFKKSMKGE